MNERAIIKDLEPMLRELAEKMGTTSEYLWTVMIKQAFLSGITLIGVMVVFVIIIPMWVRFAKHVYRLTIIENSKDRWHEEVMIPIYIISGILGVATIITSIILPIEMATCFFNPEYWALKNILSKIN